MKQLKILLCLSMILGLSQAFAEPSTSEKAAETANDTKRVVKKKTHRIKEKLCAKSDAACLADKAKHRTTEAVDSVKDEAKETKDKVDSNGTPTK